jgi:hypothetical protein
MRAIVLKIQANPSQKTGGTVYQMCFKDLEDGKSYTTWIDSGFRNYRNWRELMQTQIVLDNLRVKKGNLIDADSEPRLVDKEDITDKQMEIVKLTEGE